MRDGEMPPPAPPLPSEFYNSKHHLITIARDICSITNAFPTDKLVFLGLPIKVAPFALEEAQIRAVVAIFASPDILDVKKEKEATLRRYEFLCDEAIASPCPENEDEGALALRIARALRGRRSSCEILWMNEREYCLGYPTQMSVWRKHRTLNHSFRGKHISTFLRSSRSTVYLTTQVHACARGFF
jgi:hypothetical protein